MWEQVNTLFTIIKVGFESTWVHQRNQMKDKRDVINNRNST